MARLLTLNAVLMISACGPDAGSTAESESSSVDTTSNGEEGEDTLDETGTTGGPEYTPPETPWIDSDREYLIDEAGRPRVFRGVNARVEGVFDVTFDDGRERLEPIPDFGPEDAAQMKGLGFNVLRLPINWSGVEPVRDEFDEDYLDAVQAVIDICKAEGVYVMVDFHQDAFSKEIGEDGAPLWAIVPAPTEDQLMEGPLTVEKLEAARTSLPVILAFLSFFADDDDDPIDEELQAEFRDMAKHVAARFADEPYVIGYELFNEPVAEDRYLEPFHSKLAAAIREVDERHLLFFEPNAIRNFTDMAPLSTSDFSDARGVYAPHLYTLIFTDPDDELANLSKDRLRENFDHAVAEAQSWATPLFIGEWGIGPDMVNAEAYTRYMSELLDEHFLSSTNWVWKENAQGFWGFFDYAQADESWTARPAVHTWHDRPYALAVGGTPISMSYDIEAARFSLSYAGREDGAPCEVYVPEALAENMSVTCDGEVVEAERDEANGRVELSCGAEGEHLLVISG